MQNLILYCNHYIVYFSFCRIRWLEKSKPSGEREFEVVSFFFKETSLLGIANALTELTSGFPVGCQVSKYLAV